MTVPAHSLQSRLLLLVRRDGDPRFVALSVEK